MRRFPPRDLPPRDRPPRRDPAPFIIGGTLVFLAVIILLVFLLSGLFGSGDGDGTTAVDGSGINATQGEMPALPPGLVALSNFVECDTDAGKDATIALPLRSRPEEDTTLGFYTYLEGRW